MRKILLFIVAVFLMAIFVLSCDYSGCKKYRYDSYFEKSTRDTLLTDMVTFIGPKPRTANYLSRLETQHRGFYIQQTQGFSIEFFYKSAADTFYFYMIRPARSPKGNTRGVGGKFTLNPENYSIEHFEEIFNTPIYDRDELKVIGCDLFQELKETGNIERYIFNSDLIEWPDDRLKYDKVRREWRYDVE